MADAVGTETAGADIAALLDQMSVPELSALIVAAESKRREKVASAKTELVSEFQNRAKELGLSLNAILPAGRGKKAKAKIKSPARYRGPNGEEWSGRGRTPKWVEEVEGKGQNREEFAVKP